MSSSSPDQGAISLEYALVATLIALVAAGAVGLLGIEVLDLFAGVVIP